MPDPSPSVPRPPDVGRQTGPGFAQARTRVLEDAADRARLAPSVHNTQPWILALDADRLTFRADRSRQLTSLDPAGRALTLSVGAALLNARAALSGHGWSAEVDRLPRPDDPDLLAEVRPVPGRPDSDLALLDDVIARRRTNRRHFAPDPLPDDLVDRLRELVGREGTELVVVRAEEDRRLVARLTREADRLQNSDPAYRAELRRWTTRPPASGEGVPARAVPHTGGEKDELPLRDFDTTGSGQLPADTGSDADQTLVVLATREDTPLAWLQAGEALELLLLELTRVGWSAGPVTQAVEVPRTRAQLRAALTGDAHPQTLLRIGHAAQTPRSPRRRREDVVRGSRPAEPLPARRRGPDVEPTAERHGPVSDGRGGTVDGDLS